MSFIKQTALSIGFDACGIAKAQVLSSDAAFMQTWLSEGKQGEMSYLNRNFEKRIDPRILVLGCKSVVVLLMNYYPKDAQVQGLPKIAKYAHSEIDYHTVIKNKLKELENIIVTEYGKESINADFQHSFVDSAPVLERRWAQLAGLGWIGKHTQLIAPNIGSYCFIAVLMLNIELEYDKPMPDRCGTCNKCVIACPTKALDGNSLDARRCISYLTIEKKNTVDLEFQKLLSNCIIGCDICADVCPWNKKWAKHHNHTELKPVEEIYNWKNDDWDNLTSEIFKQTFKSSAIKRAGFNKLSENIQLFKKNNLKTE